MGKCKLSDHLNKYQRNMMSEIETDLAKTWDDTEYLGYKANNNLTLLFTDDFTSRNAEVIATTYCSMDR